MAIPGPYTVFEPIRTVDPSTVDSMRVQLTALIERVDELEKRSRVESPVVYIVNAGDEAAQRAAEKISRFGGKHGALIMLTPEEFKAATDPERFWQL